VRNIARTMFETDRIIPEWVARCNEMDEVWVPATFNVETFARSGVAREKLFVVPGALPLPGIEAADPALRPLLEFPGFLFLSVFGWSLRKGWDVLVRAYLEEFRADEDVTLLLHVALPPVGYPDARHELDQFVRQELGRDPADGPPILVYARILSTMDMLRLYRSANAFVLPTRGEGFGRPYLEAMAAGVPVIASRWSGHLDFVTDENGYLIDTTVEDVPERFSVYWPVFRGHRWGEPSVTHLRRLMRQVFEERAEAAARALRGQREVCERFTWSRVAGLVAERLGASAARVSVPPMSAAALQVTWEGPQFVHFGMAVVNRELCRALDRQGVALSLVADAAEDGPGDPRLEELATERPRPVADVHVRHEWPPRFDPPPHGHWVMIQPWEFGALPRAWVEPMNAAVDEVWVPSQFVKACYVRSGVDPRRVAVVPNGVDAARFHPDAPPLALPTRKRFRFLFVGGTLYRKGADILLDAYCRTFRREDDVCLVVKEMGASSFYAGQTQRDRLRALAGDAAVPEVVYVEDDLDEAELPGLYTACDVLVAPYRGEGFALPLLEAMACGRPVIAPGAGPALELCDPATSWLLPARERRLPEARVGGMETVDVPWLCEVDPGALALAMRDASADPERTRARGIGASARVRRDFGWERAAARARERLRSLHQTPVRRHAPPPAARAPELSVCLIVRDEEARLGACLESVRDVADEIVVVDTGSVDATREVARAAGARVFDAPWTDDWAAARNVSLDQARGDWILVIDADQKLDPGSHRELRRLIQHEARVGYLLRQLNYLDETGAATVVEHLTVRLFPRHRTIRYAGRIHEQVVSLDPEAPLELLGCGVVVHHDGYRRPAQRRAKAERDLPILERLAAEQPADPFGAYNLGATYLLLGRAADAERALRRAIALGGEPTESVPGHVLWARVLLANALLEQDRPADAAAACRELLGRVPECADAWCALGTAETRLGRLEAAAEAYRNALACRAMPRTTLTDWSTSGWKAWCGLGQVELLRGRSEAALDAADRAAAANARAPEVVAVAEACLEQASRHDPGDPRVLRLRGRLRAVRGDLDGALVELRAALERNASDPSTLVVTADVLLALGAVAEAETAYRAALAFEPGLSEAQRGLAAAQGGRP
jgi:glycosyltransferase involved in cell wall biosynthesis/tetratricopeptide (TPR) repeat protein